MGTTQRIKEGINMSYTKTVYEEVKEMLETGYTVYQVQKITGYDEEYIQGVEEDIANGIR